MQHEACVKRVGRQETQTKRRQKSGSVKIKAQSNQSSQKSSKAHRSESKLD